MTSGPTANFECTLLHRMAMLALIVICLAPPAFANGDLPEGATVHVAPLTNAMWNQGRHYNRMCPTTDVASCCDGRMWAGCTAIATGIIMRHYNWPAQGQTGISN